MDIPLPAAPTPRSVANDRSRLFHAVIGSAALVGGLWLAWLLAWALGWSLDDLGVTPREPAGLIGILTAPFAHASFAHLMSNTLPMGMLSTLVLYVYPRAARLALPLIWLSSGLGVWLFARSSVHVGASGIASGLMFFLFVMGLIRRDRLAVITSLVVFWLYGGMVYGVLPQEPHISFEYHLAGALSGVLAALLLHARDPAPPRKHYAWENEDPAEAVDDELELPRAHQVPVLWQRGAPAEDTGQVIVFRPRGGREAPPPTLH